METLLYGELVPWYRLLDPPEDHADEVALYADCLQRAVSSGRAVTLLELGAGAGGNASHLAAHFRCTLTDISEPMLDLSRELNPGCEHLVGDMRSVRLGRTFDAVLVHDAVSYMTTRSDLRAAAETAFHHTRAGGAALFVPDAIEEGFTDRAELHQNGDGDRAMRCLEWWWDPQPGDDRCVAEFAFLLRDGVSMRAVHDRHECGLFGRDTWLSILRGVGFAATYAPVEFGDGYHGHVFVCRKEASSR